MDPSLLSLVYQYSRDNLAVVNVYIKNPVVTKIRRDQKIPIIWFVANSGGILGLCMGFSMVTVGKLFRESVNDFLPRFSVLS